MRVTMVPVTKELARAKLEERRARLARLIELEAPELIIDAERRMVRAAVYAVETGVLPVTAPDGGDRTR